MTAREHWLMALAAALLFVVFVWTIGLIASYQREVNELRGVIASIQPPTVRIEAQEMGELVCLAGSHVYTRTDGVHNGFAVYCRSD